LTTRTGPGFGCDRPLRGEVGVGVGVGVGVALGIGALLGLGAVLAGSVFDGSVLGGAESVGDDVGAHPPNRTRASAPLVTHDLRISTREL
jgi:hypothetical protein